MPLSLIRPYWKAFVSDIVFEKKLGFDLGNATPILIHILFFFFFANCLCLFGFFFFFFACYKVKSIVRHYKFYLKISLSRKTMHSKCMGLNPNNSHLNLPIKMDRGKKVSPLVEME